MTATSPQGEILFLAHRIPWPPDRGDKIRSYNELQAIARIAPVHVGCFADDARDESFAPAMARVTASQCVVRRAGGKALAAVQGIARGEPLSVALFRSRAMHAYVRRLLAERPIRAIFGFSSQIAQFVPEHLPDGVRFVMDMGDVDSEKFAAYGREQGGVMGWVYRREGRVLAAYEDALGRRADNSLFVSEAEAQIFRARAGLGTGKVRAMENGVDTVFFDPAAQFAPVDPAQRGKGPFLVFTGQMDYRPNIEAVTDFAERSMPVILAAYPQARFAIVGRSPTPAVQALGGRPGIIVTGEVPDVRGWIAGADLVVAPLRIARGIQNKALEAMAMARPVLCSAQAAEGIDAQDGKEFLVVRAPEEEAAAVLALLADPARGAAIGQAARARVKARYSWDAAMAPLAQMLFGPQDVAC
jgi:sugar transferase (PEP-CTERM/EpsH1 system associated)